MLQFWGVTKCIQEQGGVYLVRPAPPTNTGVLRSVAAAVVTIGCCERPTDAVDGL